MLRRARANTWLAGLVASIGALVLAPSSRASIPELEAYEGSWEYADGRRGIERIEEAVNHAVDGMPFFLAPIARQMVRGRTGPYRIFRIGVRGEHVSLATERWGPVETRLGAPPVRIVAPEGTRLEFTQRRDRAGRIVQLFSHPDGARENALALSGDRQWLWMSVRISSPRLPHECRFRIRYRRTGGSPVAAR